MTFRDQKGGGRNGGYRRHYHVMVPTFRWLGAGFDILVAAAAWIFIRRMSMPILVKPVSEIGRTTPGNAQRLGLESPVRPRGQLPRNKSRPADELKINVPV